MVASRRIERIYLVLVAGNTLAASVIWGINTLFLLDAGLNNLQAFAANAFYTVGMVLFEIPTGVIADARGRRTSYLLGAVGGGGLAQATSLGTPFLLRVVALLVMTVVAATFMRDLGFAPDRTGPLGPTTRCGPSCRPRSGTGWATGRCAG